MVNYMCYASRSFYQLWQGQVFILEFPNQDFKLIIDFHT
jgi:hypothetical protein